MITSTGSSAVLPSSSGNPGWREPQVTLRRIARIPAQPVRRIRPAVLRPQPPDVVPEPGDRPLPVRRSAITVAGNFGNSASRTRTRASNGENDVGTGLRSYFGGPADATALPTVALPMPSCLATCRCGTPSATSRRISAQSSTEITHPICLGGLIFKRRYGLIFERCRQMVPEQFRLQRVLIAGSADPEHV